MRAHPQKPKASLGALLRNAAHQDPSQRLPDRNHLPGGPSLPVVQPGHRSRGHPARTEGSSAQAAHSSPPSCPPLDGISVPGTRRCHGLPLATRPQPGVCTPVSLPQTPRRLQAETWLLSRSQTVGGPETPVFGVRLQSQHVCVCLCVCVRAPHLLSAPYHDTLGVQSDTCRPHTAGELPIWRMAQHCHRPEGPPAPCQPPFRHPGCLLEPSSLPCGRYRPC